MDKISIIGRLTRDPEMRYMQDGKPVTSFSVACNRDYKVDDTWINRTIFYRVSAFGPVAEVLNNHYQKGREIYVEGQLTPDWKDDGHGNKRANGPKMWTDRDGAQQASFEITLRSFEFLGSKKENTNGDLQNTIDEGAATTSDPADEIPF
jgi:single-strand DNA-binding protein